MPRGGRELSPRPRDKDVGRGYSKERSHSTSTSTSTSSNSSSSQRSKPIQSQRDTPGGSSGAGKSRHSADRERSAERDSALRKSRLKPPPVSASGSGNKSSGDMSSSSPKDKTTMEFPDKESPGMMDKFELYAAINKREEEDARKMDPNVAVSALLQGYAELREMVIAVYEARKNTTNAAELSALVGSDDILAVETEAAAVTASARRVSRFLKLRLKHAKEDSVESRQSVDKSHLGLQNLIYEAIHLKKQVIAVKDYKSMDEQIDLIPLDQFYKEAPEKISKPHITHRDSHLLRIARLEYEFIQRQQVTQECNELFKKTELMSEEIEGYKRKMEAVKPILTNILKALQPAQEFYNPGITAKRIMYKTSEFLPPPLYVLFVSSVGYQEFLGQSSFSINILGDVDEAKEMVKSPDDEPVLTADSDMEIDEPAEPEPEPSGRRSMRRHTSFAEERQDHAKKIVETHPLYVEWTIQGEQGETLKLHFHYLTKLRIVTVQTQLDLGGVFGNLKDLVSERSSRILENMYKNDDGAESPNPSTYFYLKISGFDSFSELVPKVGHPFRWAQELSGVEFPVEDDGEAGEGRGSSTHEYDFLPEVDTKPNRKVSLNKIDDAFKRICRRLKCQSLLWTQLRNLETRTLKVPSELQKFFPAKNASIFLSWEAINWETYKTFSGTEYPIAVELVTNESLFFKAVIERGRARVIAAVAVTLNYPDEPPIFSIQLDDSGIGKSRVNPFVFREVERELNVFCVKEFVTSSAHILTLQLQRLLFCVDICLETMSDDDSVGPSEFAREKLFESRVKGKAFRRPFKYVPKLGGHFTQRF